MSDHEISIISYVAIEGVYFRAQCSCGWIGKHHNASIYTQSTVSNAESMAALDGKSHLKLAISSEYGKEQEKHASTADWHIIVESPRGGTYTVIIDGLAEAVDYANTMRELGWTLIDFHREQS